MKFEEFGLKPSLLEQLHKHGFTDATSIQEKVIPEIHKGKDVVGQSETGSGKTIAFNLPILDKIVKGKGVQVLVLTPTRELCVQVKDAFELFGRGIGLHVGAVYGGVGINPQFNEFRRAEVIVATPGRLMDHLKRGSFNTKHIKFLVLDEVDKMCEMGFVEDVESIINQLPKQRQTLLFSATIPENVKGIIHRYLHNPVMLKTKTSVDKSLLKQSYYEVKEYERFSLMVHFLNKHNKGLSLVFCATRHQVDSLSYNLQKNGVNAMAIHGGLSQNRRDFALDSLKKQHIQVLVATDVAARGLDIKNVVYVYNYDVPKTSEDYVHRIGRTARAGESGEAITFLSNKDHDNFRNVLRDRSLDIPRIDVPEFQRYPYLQKQRREFSRGNFREGSGFRGRGSSGFRGGHSGGSRGGFQGRRDSDGRREHSGEKREYSDGRRSFSPGREGRREHQDSKGRGFGRSQYNM
ncbi:MAG TPA: DEAD/DEAH box helicase [Candidatus Nanoarchaeia archaeon]|nr:DEAD/DEAH box helicase [Candidatus Nanoarchaeia archaeon]